MALYAFDGTGNEDRDDNDFDSNVLRFYSAYEDPAKNDDPRQKTGSLYLKGIGTKAATRIGKKLAMGLGLGGHSRVANALERLDDNRDAGDRVIDVIGFSRGAALALSFANRVAKEYPNDQIRFLGLWDVVAQFGLPGEKLQAGHELEWPKNNNVQRCYHAMALDERRKLFPLTRVEGPVPAGCLSEVWFRGVHSDIGGGNGNCGLNWISLHWMFQAAIRAGLPISLAVVEEKLNNQALPRSISDHKIELGDARPIRHDDVAHHSVEWSAGSAERPHNNPGFALRLMQDSGQIA